jgi:hypothetical protein
MPTSSADIPVRGQRRQALARERQTRRFAQSNPVRQERDFSMRRQGRQNRHRRQLTSAETQKGPKPIADSRQKEAYLSPAGKYLVRRDWMVSAPGPEPGTR